MKSILTACTAALCIAAASPAAAQFTVHDPANYAQNLLQAARALEQVQHQLTSLQNEAKNLLPLGGDAASALNGDLAEVNRLLNQAGRLATTGEGLRAQLLREYPDSAPAGSGKALAAAADARWRNSLEALRRSLEVQAAIGQRLAETNAKAAQLTEWSQQSVGALQAAQAGNQLLAVQSKQLADLTALLAAQSQAQALEQARSAAAAADARARFQRFVGKPGQ